MRSIAKSLAALLVAAALQAQTAESVLDTGIEQFHQGQYETARKSFQQAVKLSPVDARAITFLAIANAALGNCGMSSDELKLQTARNPDLEIRKLAGLAFIQCQLPRNQFSEIMPVLAQLQRTFPSDPDVIYEAAKVYNKAWNFSIYDLFQKSPASFRVNQLSAEVFETQSRYSEAAAEYRKAIEKSPVALNLHYRLGRALLLQSHDPAVLDQAREQFEAELKLNPGDAVAEYQIAQICLNQQKNTEAADHFEKSLALAPSFAEALIALGKLRLDQGEHHESIVLLERAVKAQPAMEAAHYSLMLAYRGAGKNKEAQREKKELDKLRRPPEGEFTDFLKKLGEKGAPPPKP